MYSKIGRPRPIYRLTYRLREGRTADVRSHEIASTVSGWLAELGVRSPLVNDFARAVDADNWPAAHAIGDFLSVDVTVAAGGDPGAVAQSAHTATEQQQQRIVNNARREVYNILGETE